MCRSPSVLLPRLRVIRDFGVACVCERGPSHAGALCGVGKRCVMVELYCVCFPSLRKQLVVQESARMGCDL